MKYRSAVLWTAAWLLVLSGCGDGTKPGTLPGAGKPKQTLNIVWAQWAPADVLKQMADEWGKANNVDVNCTFFPWTDYQNKLFAEFKSGGTHYDIAVGDSQWIGKGATEGHFLEITDWLTKDVSNVSEFDPVALKAYCEYPQGSGRLYAAPCEIDGTGFAYRKDWFEDAKEKEAFKAKYNRELAPPKTWAELKDIAEFFQRPDKKQYGAALFTDDDQYDAVTMGFMQVLFAWGGAFCDSNFKVDGVMNSKEGIEALQFYKDLCQFSPPGGDKFYHDQCRASFTSGQVAMTMHYFALMPPLADEKTNPLAKNTGYFAVPSGPAGRFASLGGGGISIMKKASAEKQELAKNFIKWFLTTDNQKKWGSHAGCFSANTKANSDPAVFNAAPFNHAYIESLPLLRDFYNTPEFGDLLKSCQAHWHAAIAGKETPKDAMDLLAKEHTKILQDALKQ